MPSTVIPCKDCAKMKKAIEDGGGVEVTSCKPQPGEEDKPKNEQWCRIVWRFVQPPE